MRTGPAGHRGRQGMKTENKYLNREFGIVLGCDLSAEGGASRRSGLSPALAPPTNPARHHKPYFISSRNNRRKVFATNPTRPSPIALPS